MNIERERIKQELIEKFKNKLEEMFAVPTVTMTDIENMVGHLQKGIGHEAAENLLRLKKTYWKER